MIHINRMQIFGEINLCKLLSERNGNATRGVRRVRMSVSHVSQTQRRLIQNISRLR